MNSELTELNINEAWQRILASVAERGATNAFHASGSDDEINQLESRLGVKLPHSLRALLQCENGCVDYSDALVVATPFLSAAQIGDEWACNCEADEDSAVELGGRELADLWWHKRCIPIAGSDGDCVCIDAQTNKIYSHNHGMGGLRGPTFPSLVEWLSRLADRLEAGEGEIMDGKLAVEHW